MTQHTVADPYWSRTAGTWEAVERQDPVVWGDSAAAQRGPALGPGELQRYERDGFHHAPRLFTEKEAAALLDEAERLAASADRSQPGVVTEPGSGVVRSLFRIHDTSDVFRGVALDARLLDVAELLLGGDICIHQSRINFKPAFDGKEFFWHSDFETWHMEDGMPRMRAVSVSISLTDNNEFNGPLMVVPGSHWTYVRCQGETPANHFEQSLKKQQYGVPSREAMCQLVDRGGMVAPKGAPGAALFFECNLMHGSGGNLSPRPRTNLFIVYNSVDNALVEPFGGRPPRPAYLADRECSAIRAWRREDTK
jgi:ectoine hydroxylase